MTPREPREVRRSSVTSDLAARIKRAQQQEGGEAEAESGAATKDMTALSRGIRLGTEFIAAILVGAGVGYFLDQWLGTSPWILLVMLMVGFAAGVVNVTRSVEAINKAAPPPPADSVIIEDDAEDEDDR
jgi:ATP synthase protein I